MSYIEKLIRQINEFVSVINTMLDNSSIFFSDPNSGNNNFVVLGFFNPFHWEKKDEKNQIKAKEKYDIFYSKFKLLLDKALPNMLEKITESNDNILRIIKQDDAPGSIEGAKRIVEEATDTFIDYLKLLDIGEKECYIVPDTNSLIKFPEPSSYRAIASTEKFYFIILPTVLSELDKLKINHKNETFRKKITSIIKRLKGYRKQGDILNGVIVDKNIIVKMIATEPDFTKTLGWLDPNNNDDRIIANSLELQIKNPGIDMFFVTSDINLQNKAELANLTVFDSDEIQINGS